jgi:hypothetical protein
MTESATESTEPGEHNAAPVNSPRVTNLAGKDYFTLAEAAEYACISVSHWRAKIQREFPPGEFNGKLLYRRSGTAIHRKQGAMAAVPMPAANFVGRRAVRS